MALFLKIYFYFWCALARRPLIWPGLCDMSTCAVGLLSICHATSKGLVNIDSPLAWLQSVTWPCALHIVWMNTWSSHSWRFSLWRDNKKENISRDIRYCYQHGWVCCYSDNITYLEREKYHGCCTDETNSSTNRTNCENVQRSETVRQLQPVRDWWVVFDYLANEGLGRTFCYTLQVGRIPVWMRKLLRSSKRSLTFQHVGPRNY